MSWAPAVSAAGQDGVLLDGPEGKALSLVTGFHSVRHKKSGFEVRLLEADGSASVAQDPVALYVVVTNNGASDLVERAWRIPRGVARVRGVSASDCGVEVRVDVDRPFSDGKAKGLMPKVFRLCFLSPQGKLEANFKVTETSR
jgi:hypothetical protein